MTAMNITILCKSTNISRLPSLRSIVTFVVVIIARIEPSLGIKDGRNETVAMRLSLTSRVPRDSGEREKARLDYHHTWQLTITSFEQ